MGEEVKETKKQSLVKRYRANRGLNIITKGIVLIASSYLLKYLIKNQEYLNTVDYYSIPIGILFTRIMWIISSIYLLLTMFEIVMWSKNKKPIIQITLATAFLVIIIIAAVNNQTIILAIEKSFIRTPEQTAEEQKLESIEAFKYVNQIREDYGRQLLLWNESLFYLANARAKDMFDKKYFDHITPEGKCLKDIKESYGFKEYTLAENIAAKKIYNIHNPESEEYALSINATQQVDGWMNSRGHRFNLLYPEHIQGAMSCYHGICVFIGLNLNPTGFGYGLCETGEASKIKWDSLPLLPGEA